MILQKFFFFKELSKLLKFLDKRMNGGKMGLYFK